MLDRIDQLLTRARRRWLYRVSWAALLVLGVYGVVNGEQMAAWAFLAAAVLGVADVHTDPSTPDGMPRGAKIE